MLRNSLSSALLELKGKPKSEMVGRGAKSLPHHSSAAPWQLFYVDVIPDSFHKVVVTSFRSGWGSKVSSATRVRDCGQVILTLCVSFSPLDIEMIIESTI